MMDNAAYCQSVTREADPDRFFATLFAPAAARPALFALYAFNAEVSRVRDAVSDPIPGEIRLTWWREVLEGARESEAAAHPIAGALLSAIRDYRLPAEPLARLTEARIFDLYDDPMPSVGDLEGYAGETSSVLIRLASIISAGGSDPGGADAAGHAGVAYAITGLLRALPFHASRGQVFLPVDLMARNGVRREDLLNGRADEALHLALGEMRALARHHLQSARAALSGMRPEGLPAFLPGALIEPYLRAMQRPGYDPFATNADIPQWRRQLRLWRAARGRHPLG